ncbi:MAG: polyprenol phosphomannose-dependent alpha 1,6 mannosyltransferase MptB, partial [Solirubrobacteraceae bacterium]
MTGAAPRSRWAWMWGVLGLIGSVLVAYAAPRAVDDRVVGWWYAPGLPASRGTSLALVYIGMAVLCCAWLGLGRTLAPRRTLLLIAAAWALPLALGPPLFSRDVYSYLAQGTILRLGHSPYHTAPAALAGLGHQHLLDAVSPFWRHTTAPYGPLFLGLLAVVTAVVGSHLIAGVLLTRLLELAGAVLLAIYVPRLAR